MGVKRRREGAVKFFYYVLHILSPFKYEFEYSMQAIWRNKKTRRPDVE